MGVGYVFGEDKRIVMRRNPEFVRLFEMCFQCTLVSHSVVFIRLFFIKRNFIAFEWCLGGAVEYGLSGIMFLIKVGVLRYLVGAACDCPAPERDFLAGRAKRLD